MTGPAPDGTGAEPGGGATAVVFPGISPSSFAQVGRFLLINPEARRLTAQADEALGWSLVDRYRQAEGGYSESERVAFLVVCLALAYWAEDALDVRPDIVAGPSFGGTPAAVYAGALSFPDAVRLTVGWNRHLDEYFAHAHSDVVTQSFARTPRARLAEILGELDEAGEWYETACHVDDDFWMLSVRRHRLEWLQAAVRARGGLPLYTMSPPMHSAAFAPLRATVERELVAGLPFTDPRLPMVSDHDGAVLTRGEQVRRLLLDGIVRQVRWPGALATLRAHGVSRLCVSGPDGLWGRVDAARRPFDVLTLTPALALRPRPRQRTLVG